MSTSTESSHAVTLERERDGEIAWLRFTNEHKLNIITFPMLEDLRARVDELKADAPRVLVITGKPNVFSGGADLAPMLDMPMADYQLYVRTEYEVFGEVERLPFVTVAAIAGACIGNGTELALACDLRIASSRVKFGLPETRVGFIAPAQRLSNFVGIGQAKRLLYFGEVLRADEAEALGLLDRVVPEDEFEAATKAYAEELAAMAPVALRLTKATIANAYGIAAPAHAASLESEQQGAFDSFASEDFREGANSILERRPARFQNR